MAVTNGWGQGVINNTNGWGKLATNNIDAGSIYEDSASGDTALIGTSAAFSYSASTFTQADADPTPTITGTAGGTFSGTSGLVFVSTSTGEIDLSASTIAAHVVTYTVGGVSSNFNLSVTAAPFSNVYSMDFDGVDDYIDCGNISALNGVTEATWVGWFKRAGSGLYNLFTTYGATTTTRQFAAQGSSSTLTTYMANSGGTQKTMNTINYSFSVDTWYHLAFVYNEAEASNADKMKVYVNGVLQTNTVAGAALTSLNSSTASFEIGKLGSYTSNMFEGKSDEVAVFTSALSPTNISAIYNSGVPADLSSYSPTAWYRMGENGSYKSTQWLLPENSNKDKVSNYSFEFDAVDDVITLDATFDATGGLTLSCWVNYTSASAGSLNWLCSNGGTGGSGSQFHIRLIADGRWFMYFNGSPQDTGLTGFNDGNWHHLAMTVNYSNGDVKFYKDGSESSTVLTWGSTYSTAILKNIGGANSTPAYPYGGFVDEFSVFESIVDIATLYNSGTPTTLPSGAVAHYKMGEDATFSTNWTVPDAVGSADATSANMTIDDRVGEAPNSTSNSLSYNMVEADRETDVPS